MWQMDWWEGQAAGKAETEAEGPVHRFLQALLLWATSKIGRNQEETEVHILERIGSTDVECVRVGNENGDARCWLEQPDGAQKQWKHSVSSLRGMRKCD